MDWLKSDGLIKLQETGLLVDASDCPKRQVFLRVRQDNGYVAFPKLQVRSFLGHFLEPLGLQQCQELS